jgi:hypothetical protein
MLLFSHEDAVCYKSRDYRSVVEKQARIDGVQILKADEKGEKSGHFSFAHQ